MKPGGEGCFCAQRLVDALGKARGHPTDALRGEIPPPFPLAFEAKAWHRTSPANRRCRLHQARANSRSAGSGEFMAEGEIAPEGVEKGFSSQRAGRRHGLGKFILNIPAARAGSNHLSGPMVQRFREADPEIKAHRFAKIFRQYSPSGFPARLRTNSSARIAVNSRRIAMFVAAFPKGRLRLRLRE